MSTRDRVLEVLGRISAAEVSGERLAKSLGISRAMVWKHIRSLKEIGFPIESDGRNGYRLLEPPDLSLLRLDLPEDLRNWAIPHHYWETRSTQNLAKAGAEAGLPEGHVWLAERQTSGRGRLGRTWVSGFGGLWFSLLLRPAIPTAQAPSAALVAGLALARSLREAAEIDAELKWPNDVGVYTRDGWRKLAGILTEMAGEADRTAWLVIGVGLNVNNDCGPQLAGIAESVRALTGRAYARGELLSVFLREFRNLYQKWRVHGFGPLAADYWRLHRRRPQRLELKTAQGTVQGEASGVDASGALIVKSRRQIHHLLEGEIVA